WASPEQAEGDPKKIDIRTDVYSLGVILYQLVTDGCFPYPVVGKTHEVLNNIVTVAPTPLSRARREPGSNVDPPLHNEAIEQIVMKALAKDADRRYQNGGELARDVAKYLAGRNPATTASVVPMSIPRNRRLVATTALGVLAAGVGGLIWWNTR